MPPTRRSNELSCIGSGLNRWASIKRRLPAMFGHFSPSVARIRYIRPTRNPTPDPTGDDTPPTASGIFRRPRVGDVGSTSTLRRLDRRIRHRPLLRRAKPSAFLHFPNPPRYPNAATLETLTLHTPFHRVHSYAVDRQVQADDRRRRYPSSRQNVPDVFRG